MFTSLIRGALAALSLAFILGSLPVVAAAQTPAQAQAPAPAADSAGPAPAPAAPVVTSAPTFQLVPAAPGYGYERPPQPRLSKGLMITGISILGGSYGLAFLVGLVAAGEDEIECIDCQDVAPFLFIPVLGPFLAASQAAGDEGVFIALGMVQVVGAGLMTGGIIKYRRSKQRAREQGFVVWNDTDGRALTLDVAASPRTTGAQLKLTF